MYKKNNSCFQSVSRHDDVMEDTIMMTLCGNVVVIGITYTGIPLRYMRLSSDVVVCWGVTQGTLFDIKKTKLLAYFI